MLDGFSALFGRVQQALFEGIVQPLVFALGLGGWMEDAFDATGWLLVGVLQIAVMLAVIAPLQRWRPVEPVVDRQAVRTDILYTLIHRLGVFRLALFFTVEPLFEGAVGALGAAGWGSLHLDQLWPGVTDIPWVALLIYLVVFDFVEYAIHWARHRWAWWWSLHAVHHSQQQMTMWSDDRNHLLDDLLRDAIIVLVAQVIGVGPGQFIAVVAFTQLMESLQHANLRWSFGRWGERLLVSPSFHRTHHAIGIGHESPFAGRSGPRADAKGEAATQPATRLGGCNYGVLLPWWDMLFRTADFSNQYPRTGIRDQVEPDEQGRLRDYGRGFWTQQWLGVARLFGLK